MDNSKRINRFFLKLSSLLVLRRFVILASFYLFLVGSKIFLAIVVARSRTFLSSAGYVITMRILGVLLAFFAFFLFRDAIVFWFS